MKITAHDASADASVNSRYWPYFCEENVWWLAKASDSAVGFALFISNLSVSVVIAQQRAGTAPQGIVCWDYHVVWLQRVADVWMVYDYDTTLAGAQSVVWPTVAGVPLERYLAESFPKLETSQVRFDPLFRLIERAEFCESFSSDRSHMRGAGGAWLQQPPTWPPIGVGNTLTLMRDMSSAQFGDAINLPALIEYFALDVALPTDELR